ncbi:G-protein coupled receptor 135 [Syngnathus scovelli]|uniref:G-protein coupled receptor 135 n=1 Tax=Syngnathus scovelli TaxID=161590 RepID=UPI00211027A8|nr:G-protein coupled receptor 135 [Syngnathus scovelli]XP_049597043.1 G-protein coupled receptor 135 [Syngnathus scovelli]
MEPAPWASSGSSSSSSTAAAAAATTDMGVFSTTSTRVSRLVYAVSSYLATTASEEATVRSSEENVQGTHEAAPVANAAEANAHTAVLMGILVAAQALVLLFIFLLSSLGNFAVLIVIVKHRQLRTVTNAFIMSLSLSDFLAAVLCLPFSFVMLFSKDGGVWMFGEGFCVANGFFNTCFGIVSTLTMTLISFDRYYAIVRQPRAKMGRRIAAKLLIGVWLAAIVFSLPWYVFAPKSRRVHREGFPHCTYVFHSGTSRLGTAYSVSLITVCFLLPFALMCFCHYKICKTVRLSEIRVRPVTTYSYLLRFYSEMRTATTVLIMIVLIIFCWGPYCLMGLISALGDYTFNPVMDTLAIWLAWTNGAVNPLIYALRNPNIAMLLGRSREDGYRSRHIAAYLSSRIQKREMGLNRVERIRDHRYVVSRVGVHHKNRSSSSSSSRLSSSSPGKEPRGESAMWACKNRAVFFCRDTKSESTTLPNFVSAPIMTTADTSL